MTDPKWAPRAGSMRERVLALCRRDGGATSGDISTTLRLDRCVVTQHLAALEARHVVFRAKRDRSRLRFFGDAAQAVEWATGPAVSAPVTISPLAGHPQGETITPSGTWPKVGIAAGYDPRYQVPPDWVPQGGFLAAGVGINALTGKPWGADD